MTILQKIKEYAQLQPDKLAVIDPNTELTYLQYWDKINECANFLTEIGIIRKEMIVVKNTQDVKYLTLIHAIQLVGAVPVPLEKSVNEARILEIAQDVNATKAFIDIKIEGLKVFEIQPKYNISSNHEFQCPKLEDHAMILFTTGTTGRSKGIVLTYDAEFAVAENVKYGVEMEENNIEIIPMPMNHSFSLRRYFANMINGSTTIVIDGVVFVKIFFEMLEKYTATSMAMAPAAMTVIRKLTRDKIVDYKDQLKYIQFGSAPLAEADKDYLIDNMPNIRLYNIYGSTEMGCAAALNFNSPDNQANCIGYATKNSVFKVLDFDGNEMNNATRENPGVLSYSGTMSMKGYFQNEDLTNQTIVNGYLKATDLGFMDGKGRIFMLGRADDVIITGGNKVSPLEVEEIANSVEGVTDAICKSRPDPIVGAVPILYVSVNEAYKQELLEKLLFDSLEDFKRPKKITIIDSIPRTYNGKIDRKTEIGD